MKVKLLKKIRKRFQIVHYPTGIPMQHDNECMVLYDFDNNWSNVVEIIFIDSHTTKRIVYLTLYNKLQQKIYDYYKKYGTRRIKKQQSVIMWHKNK